MGKSMNNRVKIKYAIDTILEVPRRFHRRAQVATLIEPAATAKAPERLVSALSSDDPSREKLGPEAPLPSKRPFKFRIR